MSLKCTGTSLHLIGVLEPPDSRKGSSQGSQQKEASHGYRRDAGEAALRAVHGVVVQRSQRQGRAWFEGSRGCDDWALDQH